MTSVGDSAFGKRGGGRPWRAGSRTHKYNAKRTTLEVEDVRGRRVHTFPSRKEARRYAELDLLRRAGILDQLEIQPTFPIVINGIPVRYESGVAMVYHADFRYSLFDGKAGGASNPWRSVVEDVKGIRKTPRAAGVKKPRHEGTDTDAAKIKRALVEAIYGIRIEVV